MHDAAETLAEGTEFVGLAVVECHALGVLTETDEAETEVGFVALLVKVQPDQRTPDSIGKPSTREGVQETRPHKIARQPDGRTGNSESPRESPENCNERDRGHYGAHSADAEIQGTRDKLRHVLSNALVGVVSLTANELHSIVSTVDQPPAQVVVGEPAPPANLEHLVEIGLVKGEDSVKTGGARRNESAGGERVCSACPAGRHRTCYSTYLEGH